MKSVAVAVASLALASLANAAPAGPVAKRQCSAPTSSSTTVASSTTVSTTVAPSSTEASSTTAPASTTPPASGGGTTGSGSSHSGALFSVYADGGINDASSFPSPDAIGDWNDLILAFWLDAGVWDSAYVWGSLGDAQKDLVSQYQAAGKMIRVSAFGATEYPLQSGSTNGTAVADNIANFVISNNLNGVDIDYEDSGSFESATGGGEQFLIDLTKELRAKLPQGQYFITHAPQAPYFTTGSNYPNGAYLKVHQEVGDLIDAYEIQFYNQGQGTYDTCDGLINTSPSSWPGTSVKDLIASGIPASKIIVGKPGTSADANNGYIAPADLGSCLSQYADSVGGVMAWQWTHAGADWIAAAKGSLS